MSRARWAGLVIEFESEADADAVLDQVRDTVCGVAADLAAGRSEGGTPDRAVRRPG